MRIYLKLSKNNKIIPYSYQHLLTGTIHKWLGQNNDVHGNKSLFSFSWLQNTKSQENGINLNENSYFFISAFNTDFIKNIMKGILLDPNAFCGFQVIDIQIKNTPIFSNEERFFLNSPILLRQRIGEKIHHITFKNENFETLLTENLKRKLRLANLSEKDFIIKLDKSYAFPQTKLINYKGIENKASFVPVIVKGTPEQIGFAWSVGLGESTGIGFGSVK